MQPAREAASLNTGVSTKCTGVLLATARANAVGPNGTKIQVRALIDPDSQLSLITRALCKQLLLTCRTVTVKRVIRSCIATYDR